jgi:hypothetical protein
MLTQRVAASHKSGSSCVFRLSTSYCTQLAKALKGQSRRYWPRKRRSASPSQRGSSLKLSSSSSFTSGDERLPCNSQHASWNETRAGYFRTVPPSALQCFKVWGKNFDQMEEGSFLSLPILTLPKPPFVPEAATKSGGPYINHYIYTMLYRLMPLSGFRSWYLVCLYLPPSHLCIWFFFLCHPIFPLVR